MVTSCGATLVELRSVELNLLLRVDESRVRLDDANIIRDVQAIGNNYLERTFSIRVIDGGYVTS